MSEEKANNPPKEKQTKIITKLKQNKVLKKGNQSAESPSVIARVAHQITFNVL